MPALARHIAQLSHDLVERQRPVDGWFASPEEVQIRTVKNQKMGHERFNKYLERPTTCCNMLKIAASLPTVGGKWRLLYNVGKTESRYSTRLELSQLLFCGSRFCARCIGFVTFGA